MLDLKKLATITHSDGDGQGHTVAVEASIALTSRVYVLPGCESLGDHSAVSEMRYALYGKEAERVREIAMLLTPLAINVGEEQLPLVRQIADRLSELERDLREGEDRAKERRDG